MSAGGGPTTTVVEIANYRELMACLEEFPEYGAVGTEIMAFCTAFEADPFANALDPLQIQNPLRFERAYEYRVPNDEGVSLAFALAARPDAAGVLWAFLLHPRMP